MRKYLPVIVAGILIAYLILIFYLSSIPGAEITVETPDYILHGLAFGGLSFLLTIFFLFYLKLNFSIFFSLFFTLLYGLSDEAHQSFVPGRTPDWKDVAADLFGAIIAQICLFILIHLYSLWKSKRRKNLK